MKSALKQALFAGAVCVAVAQGAVDAATGFVNNEPVQLQLAGEQVNILRVDAITPLPGNGLIVGPTALETKRDAVAVG